MKRIIIITLLLVIALLCSCQENSIKVEYLVSEGGYIEGNTNQVIELVNGVAKASTVTAKANDGYIFVGWSDGITEPTRNDTLDKNATFTANFEKTNIISVEYKAQDGGYIEGNAYQTGEGKVNTTTVKAVANKGYRFVGWDDGASDVVRNDEATENRVFTALFKKIITVEFTCDSNEGKISGRPKQALIEGSTSALVYAIPNAGYEFVKWSTGETTQSLKVTATEDITIYAIFERVLSGFPTVSIDTYDSAPIVSKEEYVGCSVDIYNTTDEFTLSDITGKIRGRGNTTWDAPKKPYKLKLDEAVDLFGNGKARTWTLIANYTDLSLLRNYLAYSVASLFDTQKITTSTEFVDLYVNGEYLGVYLLCEQNEVHENRVNISETGEIDTGYIIELDGREDGEGFYVDDKFYAIKSPDTDGRLFTEEHREFIKTYLESCSEALSGVDYDKIEALIDTKSFAQAYIVHELFNNVDVGYASFYMYKDAGGKLQCGPVWDFDRSLGVTGHQHGAEDFATLWAKEQNIWFNKLLSHDEFVKLVSDQIIEYEKQITDTLSECYDFAYKNQNSFKLNFEKWDILEDYVWPNSGPTEKLHTWESQVEFTRQYLNDSLNFLKWIYIENL